MAGGILVDRLLAVPLITSILALVVVGVTLAIVRNSTFVRAGALALAAAALGCVLHDNAFRRVPLSHISRHVGHEAIFATVTGTLVEPPEVYERPGGHFARWIRGRVRTRMLVEAEQIAGRNGPIPATGLVRVYVKEPLLGYRQGNRVRLTGRLFRPSGASNPGELNRSLLSRRQGILVWMSCKYASSVVPADAPTSRPAPGLRERVRTSLRYWVHQGGAALEESCSLLDAIILGQRDQISRQINDAFIETGTAHFLAVSGTHVGMLAVFVWAIARVLGLGRSSGAAVVFVAVAGYVFVAEPRVPILRAGILCGLGCVAVGLRRRTSPLNWFAAGMIVLLAWRPGDLFSPGFQLSFGVVLGILLLSPMVYGVFSWLRNRLRRVPAELDDPKRLWPWWRRSLEATGQWAGWLAAISIAAWLVGSILTAYHFQRFSPLGWVNSMLVWPLVMMIVVGGFMKVLLAAALPQTTVVTGPIIDGLSRLLVGWVHLLSRLPGVSIECRQPSIWQVSLYLVGLGLAAICWRLGARRRWVLGMGSLPLIAVGSFVVGPAARDDGLTLWVLSVGDGQVALADVPGSGHWVIDAGARSGFDVGEVVAVPAFRALGVRRIRRALVSHADFDHYGGILAIDDHFPIETVVVGPYFDRHTRAGSAAEFLLEQLDLRGVPVEVWRQGRSEELAGSTVVEVLWPPDGLDASWTSNDCSIVLRVRHADRSILICGDVEEEAQRRLLEREDLRSDVMILPHHGAVARSTEAFIAAVDPSVVIRSGSRRDANDPPAIEALVADRRYLDTGSDGAIEITIDQEGVKVRAPYKDEGAFE
ncbi:MAG: ComEC/Rec2 family competence protein [Phycisphaerae bacterium]|nr:ComEC/Rec2 family competence protein [Phycisphaerae bacterium]